VLVTRDPMFPSEAMPQVIEFHDEILLEVDHGNKEWQDEEGHEGEVRGARKRLERHISRSARLRDFHSGVRTR
jgi:hypothetical protein